MQLRNTIILLGTIFLLASCKGKKSESSTKNTESSHKDNYQLVWSDEFNYNGLPDSTKWIYDTEGNADGWGNHEGQYYTKAKKENAWVEDDVLNIIALKEQKEGKEYTSARLNSKASWLHGKIEVRAKLPKGRGTWSAIWMMPEGWTYKDGDWPNIGEIDIMEHVGHNLGTIHASAHSKDYQWQTNTQQTDTIQIPQVFEKFHSYVLEWSPEVMKAYVDDKLYFEYENEGLGKSKWPYVKPFYLILNVAVGGAWGNVQGIDADAFPQSMQVDYVRIYQKK